MIPTGDAAPANARGASAAAWRDLNAAHENAESLAARSNPESIVAKTPVCPGIRDHLSLSRYRASES